MNQLAQVLDLEPVLNKFVREHFPRPNMHVVYRDSAGQESDHQGVVGVQFASASVFYKEQGRQKMVEEPARKEKKKKIDLILITSSHPQSKEHRE